MGDKEKARMWIFFCLVVIIGYYVVLWLKTCMHEGDDEKRGILHDDAPMENSVFKNRKPKHWPERSEKYALQPWLNKAVNTITEDDDTVKKRFPTVICIGVKKCGTSAFTMFMGIHPDLKKPKSETHFFDSDRYYNGYTSYRTMMPKSQPGDVVMEKSPRYFVLPAVVDRISEWNRDVKLIAILCDPIARAYSDFRFISTTEEAYRRKGLRDITFEEHVNTAITDILKIQDNPQETLGYGSFEAFVRNCFNYRTFRLSTLTLGMYYYHLKNWYNFFSPDQLLIVDGDQLIKNPLPELKKAEKFMGLRDFINESMIHYDDTKGFYCVTDVRCTGKSKGLTRKEGATKMNQTTHEKLSLFFKPYNEKLFKLLGRTFDWD